MIQPRKVVRALAHGLIWLLVIWGIYRAAEKSTVQLEAQRNQLSVQADSLEKQAEQAPSDQAQRLKDQASALRTQIQNFWKADWSCLFLAGLVYAAGMLPAAYYWFVCLEAMGQVVPWRFAAWAYFYGNLGKYVPGKAMVVVLRLAILAPFGIKKVATTLTIFMETLSTMAVGGAIAAVCVICLNLDWRISLLAVGLLLATVVPTAPALLRYVLFRLQPGVDREVLTQWTERLNWRLTLRGWSVLGFTWVGFGLSLGFVLQGLPSTQVLADSSLQYWLSIYAACALAVVVGFVSLMPGGAGVRELVLTMILSPIVGPTAALCCAVWLRITWLATELLMAGLAYLLKNRVPKHSEPGIE